MISFIRGELVEILENTVVVDNSGMGFNIEVPLSVVSSLPGIGDEVKLYTYLNVREDAMKLFGFLRRDDLDIFKILIGVSGIGPKGALSILSAMTPNDLRIAVMSDDAKAISKAPGIGLKTAQKLIIEAKGKISLPDFMDDNNTVSVDISRGVEGEEPRGEAIAALVALGYSNSEAVSAVKKVEYKDGMDAEAILKASLKHLTFL